jgi:MYXO-CTERM domain-containing protein
VLTQGDFVTLGADVLTGPQDKPAAYAGYDLVLTRLHARYGKTLTDDLRFRAAPPIAGGRELAQNGQGGLEEGAQPAAQNNFQGRYAIRHPWTGPIRCEHPARKIWGGPPSEIAQQAGFQPPGIQPAVGLAFAPRGEVQLARVVLRDIPELGIVAGAAATTPAAGSAAGSATAPSAPPAARPAGKARSGCGCASSGGADVPGGALLLGVGLIAGQRQRQRRRAGGGPGRAPDE